MYTRMLREKSSPAHTLPIWNPHRISVSKSIYEKSDEETQPFSLLYIICIPSVSLSSHLFTRVKTTTIGRTPIFFFFFFLNSIISSYCQNKEKKKRVRDRGAIPGHIIIHSRGKKKVEWNSGGRENGDSPVFPRSCILFCFRVCFFFFLSLTLRFYGIIWMILTMKNNIDQTIRQVVFLFCLFFLLSNHFNLCINKLKDFFLWITDFRATYKTIKIHLQIARATFIHRVHEIYK